MSFWCSVTVASTGGCDGFVVFSNRIVSEETQKIRSKLIAKLLRPTGGWRTPEWIADKLGA